MDAEVHKIRNGFIGIVVFFTGLLLFSGCSQETASKPQQTTALQHAGAKQEPSKATTTEPSQSSSLEALQKGTLGKPAEEGPLRDVNFDFDRYDLLPLPERSLRVMPHGSKRILKSGLRLKGTVTIVEPTSITWLWEQKEQRA